MRAMASVTRRSNAARVIGRSGSPRRPRAFRRRLGRSGHAPIVIAIADHQALIAERLWPADATAMQDLHIGGECPQLARQRSAELCLNLDGIVALGDTDAVRHAQHVSIDREPWYAERMTEHHIRGLAANTRQFRQPLHVGWYLASVLGDERLGHADQGFGLLSKEAGGLDLLFE